MKLLPILIVAALAPLTVPAAGEVSVPEVPDRVFVLVMQGAQFNAASWPSTPLLEAVAGETVQFTVAVPLGAEPHTFHLHGHPWRLADGRAVDTVLLNPGEAHTFLVQAGGPYGAAGDWMYHCHFDDHVKDGMWGVFRVHPEGAGVPGAVPGPGEGAAPPGGHVH